MTICEMTMTAETLREHLKNKPYLQLPFPVNNVSLDKAITSYFKFLELPDEVKSYINIKISPLHRRGDIGFAHREPSDGIYNDSKDFFHFHPKIFDEYKNFLKDQPIICDFLNNAMPIWQTTHDISYQILQLFEKDFPGTIAKIFDTKDIHIIVRFLKYNWSHSGKYLAKPHFDAGSFTLAIAESCPGLRIGKGPDDLQAIDHEDGKAVFFVSSNFKKIIDTDDLSPGWHDVIQLDETQLGKPFARWAIVAFIEGHNVESLPRSETHKWYDGQY